MSGDNEGVRYAPPTYCLWGKEAVAKRRKELQQEAQARAALKALDRSENVFRVRVRPSIIEKLTTGHMPVRFSKDFIAEL